MVLFISDDQTVVGRWKTSELQTGVKADFNTILWVYKDQKSFCYFGWSPFFCKFLVNWWLAVCMVRFPVFSTSESCWRPGWWVSASEVGWCPSTAAAKLELVRNGAVSLVLDSLWSPAPCSVAPVYGGWCNQPGNLKEDQWLWVNLKKSFTL